MSTKKYIKKFEQIYDKTYNNTLKYIIYKSNNLNDIDDIVQETFLELYKVLKTEKNILNYEAYIMTIAKNKIIKYSKLNEKIRTISIFQENNDDAFLIDLDSRYRYRITIYNKRQYK